MPDRASEPSAASGLTRRGFARRSGAGALLLGSGSSLAGLLGAATASGQRFESGEAVLTSALGLENSLRTVYAVAERSGELDVADRALVRELGEQNRVRADLLEELLDKGASKPPVPKASRVPGLGAVSSRSGYLNLALGFENQVYLAYLDSLNEFDDSDTIRDLARLAAGTAQHLSLLRRALGRTPAPSAFETGAAL